MVVGLLSLIFTLIYLKLFLAQIGKFQMDIVKWVSVQLSTVSESQVNMSPERSSFRRANSDHSIDSTMPLDEIGDAGLELKPFAGSKDGD